MNPDNIVLDISSAIKYYRSTEKKWGFPYLSGAGRLVIKDLVILGGAIITMSESAQLYLKRKSSNR